MATDVMMAADAAALLSLPGRASLLLEATVRQLQIRLS
jgi:hypothetical protein